MGRSQRLPGPEAERPPEPQTRAAASPKSQGKKAQQQRRRRAAWAWPWAWPLLGGARGVSGAWRAGGSCDGCCHGGGGCCARYWGRCLRRRRRRLSPPRAPARCGLVMATTQRPFHLVVFGASGFTGQFVTEEVAREQVDSEGNSRLPWAVAGRCREKLQGVLERAALKLGKGGGVGLSSWTPGSAPPPLLCPRNSLLLAERSKWLEMSVSPPWVRP